MTTTAETKAPEIDIGIDAPQRKAVAGGLAHLLADQVTMDVLTERMERHEESAWMLRRVLE